LGLLAGEAHLDVAGGQLGRELHGRLREEVEQLEPEARADRLGEAPRDLRRALVAELRQPLQVVLESLEHDRQIHRDITLTSSMLLVKRYRSAPVASDATSPSSTASSGA